MDRENDNPEMKDIMRIRTLLNRKQKNAEGKAKQKDDDGNRKETHGASGGEGSPGWPRPCPPGLKPADFREH